MRARYSILIVTAFLATLAGLWYVLSDMLRLPFGAVMIVFAPTALVMLFAVVYGYHLGAERVSARSSTSLTYAAGASLLFSAMALAAGIAVVALASAGRLMAAGMAGLPLTVSIGLLIARPRRAAATESFESRDETFNRRFRLAVFGVVLTAPTVLSAVFIVVYRNLQEGIVFLVIAAAASAWLVPKCMREFHDHGRSGRRYK